MNLQDMKVVVSDNSVLMRKKLRDMIATMGFGQIYEATNGQQVVDLYKEHHPQLVFMDILMPIKTGVEATAELMCYDQQAYIVIVSPETITNKLQEAIQAGARDFLKKPIKEEAVKEIVKHYLGA